MALMETVTGEHAFCLRCGYDLTGLDLPRDCPECGHRAEASYEERARPAREWFNSRRAWLWWVRGTSKLPAGLFYVLHDAASRRTARRRVLVLLCLPAVLTSLIVLLGNGVSVDYAVRVWYYDKNDPHRCVLRETHENETTRFFVGIPQLSRDVRFSKRPTNWVQVVERTPVGLHVSAPHGDPMAGIWVSTPWCLVMCGYFLGWMQIDMVVCRKSVRARFPGWAVALPVTASLITPAVGGAIWLWLLFTVAAGTVQAGLLPGWTASAVSILAAMAWAASCLLGWPRLVCLDTLGLVFRRPTMQTAFFGGAAALPLLWITLLALL